MQKIKVLKTIKGLLFTIIISLSFVLIAKGSVNALTSENISFQGKIVRNDTGNEGLNVINGSPACVVDGIDTCDFEIAYYTATSGGTLLFTEKFNNIEIGSYGGVFDLTLGTGTPTTGVYSNISQVFSNTNEVYIELRFAPDGITITETFERTPVRATAYSLKSKYSKENIGGFTFNGQSAAPLSPVAGTLYYDTDTATLNLYSGGGWNTLATGGASLWSSSTLAGLTWDQFMIDASPAIASLQTFSGDATEGRASINGSGSKSGLSVYSTYNTGTDWPLASFKADGSSFSGTILQLLQDAIGKLMTGYKGSNLAFEFDNDGGLHLASDGVTYIEGWGTAPTVSNLNPNNDGVENESCVYSYAGNLYWDALCDGTFREQLNSGVVAASLWTDGGTFSYLTSTTDDLVLGSNTVAGATFVFDVDASGGNYFEIDSADNSKTLLSVDDSGNVGIGTSNPLHSLDIAGSDNVISNQSGELVIHSAGNTHITSNAILQGSADILGDIINSSTNFNGRVYISDDLEVVGSISMPDFIYHRSDINTYVGFSANDTIVFRTNGVDQLLIDSSGNASLANDLVVQGGNITIGSENDINEGGQITLLPAGAYDALYMDVFADEFRMFSTSSSSQQVSIFGTAAVMDLYLDGNLRLNGVILDEDSTSVTFGESISVQGNTLLNGYVYIDSTAGTRNFNFYDNANTYGRFNYGNVATWWGVDNIWMNLGGTGDQRLYIRYGATVAHQLDADGDVTHFGNLDVNGDFSLGGTITMNLDNYPNAPLADTFASDTSRNYINFNAGSNGTGTSNDPGMIVHETSATETNEGVLHLMPSDDNSYGDYVSIHGTYQPDMLKLHTNGQVEGISNLYLSTSIGNSSGGNVGFGESLYVNGNSTIVGDYYGRAVDGQYSSLYRAGGLYLTWDSDTYGTNLYHGIYSTNGTAATGSMTINSYGNIRMNIDSNNNGSEYFEIGHNTTGTAYPIFKMDEVGIMTSWVGTGSGTVSFSTPATVPGITFTANNGRRADIRRNEDSLAIYTHASSATPTVGRLVIYNSGQTAVSMPHYGGSAYTDWPAGWWGGISTWDMLAAGVRYSSLSNRSDIKLKKDIIPLEGTLVLDKLMLVEPVSYTWKDNRLSQNTNYGIIAQEVIKIFPEIVETSTQESGAILSVSYTDFLPMLVLGHQDQQGRLDSLYTRISEYEQNEFSNDLKTVQTFDSIASDSGLIVGESFNIGDLEIKGNSISSFVSKLKLQNYLSGIIDFFDGNLIIDPEGNITSQGSIQVSSLELDSVSVNEAVIPAGQTTVEIPNDLIHNEVRIIISSNSKTFGNVLFVSEKKEGESFSVSIQNACDEDISFSWILVDNLDKLDD